MTPDVVDIGFWQLLLAYGFVLVLFFLVRLRRIPREGEILLSSFRMTIQLILAGYLLGYLFERENPIWTILVVCLMLGFAVHTIYKRAKHPLSSSLKRVIAISMLFGTGSSILYFVVVVLRLHPWYSARYLIPIVGMIVGNSMTGIALGVNSMLLGVHKEWRLIEGALMLGAKPSVAVKRIADEAFDNAILPTINSMLGMGIVFLPGMMTGQILSGVSAVVATRYQIAIMLGIVGGVSFSVFLFLHFGSRTFFNKEFQLLRS